MDPKVTGTRSPSILSDEHPTTNSKEWIINTGSALTRAQKALILRITDPHGDHRTMSGQQFLDEIGQTDGHAVARELLHTAIEDRNPDDVSFGLTLVHEFGVTEADEPLLSELAVADWHVYYTDVVNRLLDLGTPAVVPTLVKISTSPPGNLDELDAQTYANNAAWALYKLGNSLARSGLADVGKYGYEATKGLAITLLRRLEAAEMA